MNAVYHRGYDIREPVEIRIMHDELVVLSYPGPDRSVRLEQLRIGKAMPRRYRNRRIGEFLKELEFTEGRSTGIPKIIDAIQANGSPLLPNLISTQTTATSWYVCRCIRRQWR